MNLSYLNGKIYINTISIYGKQLRLTLTNIITYTKIESVLTTLDKIIFAANKIIKDAGTYLHTVNKTIEKKLQYAIE